MALSTKKILIVEDDKNLSQALSDRLSKLCVVASAEDGEQALEKLLDSPPDLILLDLLLPKLDGFKVLERLRNYPDKNIAEIPVVVLSNLWSNKDILQVKALRVEEYFVKAHTDLDQVVGKVQQVLAVKQG